MREGWQKVAIKDVADVINGGTPKTTTTEFWDGEHFWITPAEMGSRSSPYLGDSRRTLTDTGLARSSASLVPPKSVILSTRAPIGHLVVNTEEMAFNQGCRAVVPGEGLNYKYLYYYLFSCVDQLNELGSGTTFKELAAGKLKNFQVPLAPLKEQKRIVAILDEAFLAIDAALDNTEKNLANARELFGSYLNNVIGNLSQNSPEVGVEDACDSIIDCINKTATKVDHPTPYKMIRTTNVKNGKVNLESVKYVEETVYQQWTRRQVPRKGDVILTREAPMGEVGILDSDEKVFLGQRLVSYRAASEKLNNRFLLYCFMSDYIQDQIQKLGSGSTVLHMRVPDSERLKIPLPDLNIQSDVVANLDFLNAETFRLKNINERKKAVLNELKQSLLQKAFSGELAPGTLEQEMDEAVA
jgi:type I restriction enzyme S subunit